MPKHGYDKGKSPRCKIGGKPIVLGAQAWVLTWTKDAAT